MSILTLELIARRKWGELTELELASGPLRPCPFCGESDIILERCGARGRENWTHAVCETCDTRGPQRYGRNLAIDMWNKRA